MKYLVAIILSAVAIAIFIQLAQVAILRAENVECQKLAEYEERYPDFYYTDWQLKQCQK